MHVTRPCTLQLLPERDRLTCQRNAAWKLLDAHAGNIVRMPHVHIMLIRPREAADTAFGNRRTVIGILFRIAHETLRTIAADSRFGECRIGRSSVLHNRDHRLLWHPQLRAFVANAGIEFATEEWTSGSAKFVALIKVLADLFRRRFLELLPRLTPRAGSGSLEAPRTLPARRPFRTSPS